MKAFAVAVGILGLGAPEPLAPQHFAQSPNRLPETLAADILIADERLPATKINWVGQPYWQALAACVTFADERWSYHLLFGSPAPSRRAFALADSARDEFKRRITVDRGLAPDAIDRLLVDAAIHFQGPNGLVGEEERATLNFCRRTVQSSKRVS